MESLDKIKKHIQSTDETTRKSSGFTVPDGYFDGLTDRIMTQIEETGVVEIPQNKSKIVSLRFLFPAIAASICFIACALFLWNNNAEKEQSNYLAFKNISTEESVQFLLDNKEDFSAEQLLEIENIDNILKELEEEINN